MLLAPALWNGYPLLQWDTGGYLARWYEGYLVPSRSTVFGLYLHFGEDSAFWINLGIQALATLWILQLTLRVLGLARPLRLLAISLVLILATAVTAAAVSVSGTLVFVGLLVPHILRLLLGPEHLLLMIASFLAVPTVPMLIVAIVHCGLLQWEARREERYLGAAPGRDRHRQRSDRSPDS